MAAKFTPLNCRNKTLSAQILRSNIFLSLRFPAALAKWAPSKYKPSKVCSKDLLPSPRLNHKSKRVNSWVSRNTASRQIFQAVNLSYQRRFIKSFSKDSSRLRRFRLLTSSFRLLTNSFKSRSLITSISSKNTRSKLRILSMVFKMKSTRVTSPTSCFKGIIKHFSKLANNFRMRNTNKKRRKEERNLKDC